MKLKRLFLLGISAICLLTSCNLSKDPGSSGENKTRLNIAQSNLISKFTGNEKYLNPDLLYDVKTLDNDDQVGAIITLSKDGLLDAYMNDSRGYSDIAEYQNSDYGKFLTQRMKIEQDHLIKKLMKEGLIEEAKHSYTTLMNGFSVETTYGDYKELKKRGFASEINLSEVYSMPKTKTTKSDDVVENETGVDKETGIFDSTEAEKLGFSGSNTAVAVLDSGFDVHHTVFKNMPVDPLIKKDDINKVIASMEASKFTHGLKTEDVYINSKIPFAYDYADKDEDVAPFDSEHGTHVAGIIGGRSDVIKGVAVNTQLVLMKVFGDVSSGAQDGDIIAALEDAVTLKVDAINLSLGTACGFSVTNDKPLRDIYEKIEKKGISLIVAASNDYSSGYGGGQGNTSFATNPDSAVVGSPATYNSSLAVASISGLKSKYIKSDTGYSFYFEEANGNGSLPYDFYEMLKVKKGVDNVIEYVTIPGVGKPINYKSVDVRGKIALVKRGGISFEEKAQFAYEAGARGVLLYNNQGGEILMSAGADLKVAYASINKDDGEELAKRKEGKLIINTNNVAGPFMSNFSSWGPTPDLKLKPEITAHGGEIKSSVPGGGYDRISGTSMAAPNMCGIVVLIRQHLKERFPELIDNAKELSDLTNSILMSTATIAMDKHNNPYSPRKQGAGLGNLLGALNAGTYLTVDGKNKPKIELGDDPKRTGEYELSFNIRNMSDKEYTYKIDDYTMTETLMASDKRFIAERAYMLNPTAKAYADGVELAINEGIKVAPNSTVKIKYTLKLNNEDMRYMRQGFKNGIYVEGFVTLKDQGLKPVDLSIPFLGFFGDWTEAPLFDKTVFEVEKDKYNGAIDYEDKVKADYYASNPLGMYFHDFIIPLGSYLYPINTELYNPIPQMEEHCAISNLDSTINGILTVYAGLLRNAKRVTTQIINTETGEVVFDYTKYDQLKAHYSGVVIPSFDMIEVKAQELGLVNNVKYKFKMEAELDYGFNDEAGRNGGKDTNKRNTFEFDFYSDTQAPILHDAIFITKYDRLTKKNRYYVDLEVYDNHYAQSIRPFALNGGEIQFLSEYITPVYGERNGITTVRLEVTDYMDLLKDNIDHPESVDEYGNVIPSLPITNGLGILLDDYALNQNMYFITLPGTSATELYFADENGERLDNLTVKMGETIDIAKMIKTNDPRFDKNSAEFIRKFHWESSDETIFKVGDGYIEGVNRGSAMLKVANIIDGGLVKVYSIPVIVQRSRPNHKTVDTSLAALRPKEPDINPKANDNIVTRGSDKLEELIFTYFDTLFAYPDGPTFSEIGVTGDKVYATHLPEVPVYPGEKIRMHYNIKPFNLEGYELVWDSSNSAVASVTPDENGFGVIEAKKEGVSTITLRLKINGRLSNQTAKIRIKVNSEFIIENRFLVGYKGNSKNVVIPDDKGILGISSYAFSLYTIDKTIDCPEDDFDMNKIPASNSFIESVVIPAEVMEIGKYAFSNCTNLKRVELLSKQVGDKLETCKKIKQFAFMNCYSLEEINLEHVTVIGEKAFAGCKSLTALDFRSIYALGVEAFMGCTGLTEVDITTLRNAGMGVFKSCTNLKTIKSGEFTKFSASMFENTGLIKVDFYSDRIPARAFANCKDLKEFNIHNSIIYVGNEAFSFNLGELNRVLKEVPLVVTFMPGASCDFFYDDAFNGSGLKEITLPNSSFKLDKRVFSECPLLEMVYFQADSKLLSSLNGLFSNNNQAEFDTSKSNIYSYDSYILYNKDKTEIILGSGKLAGEFVIPDGVVRINDAAFSGNTGITGITFNTSLKYIGSYAFSGMPSLTSVKGDSRGVEMGTGVFRDCISLNSYEHLSELTTIYPEMFMNTAFTEITINANTIMDRAFMDSMNLTTINGNVEAIMDYAFHNNSSLFTINLTGVKTLGEHAFSDCTSLIEVVFNDLLTVGASAFRGCKVLSTITMPLVEAIMDHAFDMAIVLQGDLVFNDLEYIGSYAFSTMDDSKVTPNRIASFDAPKLAYIGEAAFKKSSSLVTFHAGLLNTIGAQAFYKCGLLEEFKTTNATVETISKSAFDSCPSLKNVELYNVKYIETSAFNGSALKSFDFSSVIEIGGAAFFSNKGLESLDMPVAEVLDIAAFQESVNIKNINMPNIRVIRATALSGIGAKEIKLGTKLEEVEEVAFFQNLNQEKFVGPNGLETEVLNDSFLIDNSGLYFKGPNKKLTLMAYPTSRQNSAYEVIEGTARVAYAAAYGNRFLQSIVLPSTLKSIGNLSFFKTNLSTVEFHSTVAPELEETMENVEIQYQPGTDIYEFIQKIFPIGGVRPLFYAQFRNYIGVEKDKLKIILPKNSSIKGYDNPLYKIYFDMSGKVERAKEISMDEYTLAFLDLLELVPTGEIKLNDEEIIIKAKAAQNKVKQRLESFKIIDQEKLKKDIANLNRAHSDLIARKKEYVAFIYCDLIEDINKLGSEFEYDKIAEYKRLYELIDLVNENDKKYLDTSSFESFKEGYQKYFDGIREDVDDLGSITELPTTQITVEGVAKALTGFMLVINFAGLVLMKRFGI